MLLIPNVENPLSNSGAELRMKQMKNDELNKRKHRRVSRVVRKMVQGAEERITELQYNTNIRKGTKKRKIQPSEHEPEPKKRKIESEIWRRKSNKLKLKGGIHSKKETESYATNLLHKIKKDAPDVPVTPIIAADAEASSLVSENQPDDQPAGINSERYVSGEKALL